MIAVFSIAGIILCASDSTNPSVSQSPSTGPTVIKSDLPSWNNNHIPELPPKPTFPEDTYMTVYTHWRGENYPRVSWKDSETLLILWKEMISRKSRI